jgi:DNA-binding winged helix-turn-helix (wHTH) protein/TolB-like protein/lipopolysaccharide biosynthesis regulator YciM
LSFISARPDSATKRQKKISEVLKKLWESSDKVITDRMSFKSKHVYQFKRFRLDSQERVLFDGNKMVVLAPKLFDTLLALVESGGRILEKDELMKRIWADSFVEENNLNKNISALRKLFGEENFIETIPKRGYRFVAEVKESWENPDSLVLETSTSTRIVIEETDHTDEPEQVFQAITNVTPEISKKELTALKTDLDTSAKRYPGHLPVTIGLIALLSLAGYYLWPTPSASPSPIKSIAVLPFKPLVAEGRDESLEMGTAETLITRLSGIKELTVRPTSAVRKYAALEQDPVAAGFEQKVDAVLDGNIQKTSDRIRVTIRLIRIKDGQTMWAGKFDEPLADIFALQDSISERVTEAIAVNLSGEEKKRLIRHHTDNSEAYQQYLKGRLFYNQFTEESTRKALECYDKALALDPNYALAYAGKSTLYSSYSGQYLPPLEAMPKAKEAARKALELDEQLAEAHHAMAVIIQWADWDWAGAEKEFKRALELNPNFETARRNYATFLAQQKRFDEAFAEVKEAQKLDPLSLSLTYYLGHLTYLARHYDQAVDHFKAALALNPNYEVARRGLGCALRQKGNYEQAIAELQRSVELNRFDRQLSELGHTYAVAGRRDEAMKIVRELETVSKQRYGSPVRIARIYAGLGEKDRVFELLNKGYEDHSDHLLVLGVDPSFDNVRSDPRFTNLLRRIKLEL